MQIRFLLMPCVGCIVFAGTASAYCNEPSFYSSEPSFSGSEPDAPSGYQRPDVPYCLSSYSYSSTHTCDQYELDSYFDEVNDYIDDLNTYSREAVEFAEEAADYAAEARSFANDVIEHANEIYDYAKCEANDVKQQHE